MLGRRSIAVAAALVTVLVIPAVSQAAQVIRATTVWRFDALSYTIDQGEALSFLNADVASPGPHNVTSEGSGADGKPLFASDTIAHGEEVAVAGARQLVTGSYPFLCTVHPFMTATLEVTANGTPLGSGPPPGTSAQPPPAQPAATRDTTKPRLKISLAKANLRAKRFQALVSLDEPVRLSIRLTARVGRRSFSVGRASTTTEDINEPLAFAIKPSSSARRSLKRARSAKFTLLVVATDADGNTARATARRTLRR